MPIHPLATSTLAAEPSTVRRGHGNTAETTSVLVAQPAIFADLSNKVCNSDAWLTSNFKLLFEFARRSSQGLWAWQLSSRRSREHLQTYRQSPVIAHEGDSEAPGKEVYNIETAWYLGISHTLVVCPVVKVEGISEVYSTHNGGSGGGITNEML